MAPAAPIQPPSPPPVTDRIALGASTHTFPPSLVDRVAEETGRGGRRRRLLPARVVVYFVLALALYGHAAYEEVVRCLVEGLGWAPRARRGRRTWPYWHVPGASALAEARERLGAEPLEVPFAQTARPLASHKTRGAWYRHWRLLVVDGTCLDVPDSPGNQALGRAGSGRGEGWARSRGCGWWGWWRRHARDRGRRPGSVRDRGADAGTRACPRGWPVGAWGAAAGRPAAYRRRAVAGHGRHRRGPGLAGQVRRHHRPEAARRAGVGRRVVAEPPARRAWPAGHRAGHRVRPFRPGPAHQYRPLPAGDHDLRPHRRARRRAGGAVHPAVGGRDRAGGVEDDPARPQAGAALQEPDLVAQEVWAHPLVHYALRAVVHTAALAEDLDPDRLSFIRTLRVIRRQVTAQPALSP